MDSMTKPTRMATKYEMKQLYQPDGLSGNDEYKPHPRQIQYFYGKSVVEDVKELQEQLEVVKELLKSITYIRDIEQYLDSDEYASIRELKPLINKGLQECL